MGPDADQADVLLFTFKTKIEEAISLINQMPEQTRQDAWTFWQEVSRAIKAVSGGLKKSIHGGKEIIPGSQAQQSKTDVEVGVDNQDDDDDEGETFDVAQDVVSETAVPTNPNVTPAEQSQIHDPFAHDLKLLYNSVYSTDTSEAVSTMIAVNDTPSEDATLKEGNIVQGHIGVNLNPVNIQDSVGTINVLVQDYIDDQIITSLVTINEPGSAYLKSPENSPEKSSPVKTLTPATTKRKPRKKKTQNTQTDGQFTDTVAGDNGDGVSSTKTTRKQKLKKEDVSTSEDVSQLLAGHLTGHLTVDLENVESSPGVDAGAAQVGDRPLQENKSGNRKSKPRRSERRPKPKNNPENGDVTKEIPEDGNEEKPKRRVHKPGDPKADLGPVNCKVCGVQLAYVSSLIAHMRQHTGDRPFICTVCEKPFTTKANMQRHERTHTGEKPFQCNICEKYFTEKKTLKVHMRIHSGERPFKCKVCGVGFSQSSTLKSHMLRHTGVKGNLCDLCGQAFRQKSQLQLHLKRHFSYRAFKCEHCHSTFYCKGDLSRHEMRHTGERPYGCGQCNRTFTRQQYLKEHENQHKGIKPYSCDQCSLKFPKHSTFYRHMQRHKKAKAESDEHIQLVVESQNEAGEQVPTLLVTADNLQQLFGVNAAAGTSGGEVYRIALVDSATDEQDTSHGQDSVDFSAINLLANATTQLSMTQTMEAEGEAMTIPVLMNQDNMADIEKTIAHSDI